jgi:hypothetical protein
VIIFVFYFIVPDECKDEIAGIEHLTLCLNRRYNSCPIVFTGTLKDALKEAFSPQKIREVKEFYFFFKFYFLVSSDDHFLSM